MAVGPDLLALRALGLGDLLTAVPALRGCRRTWPDHRLVLATPAPLGRWAQRLGLVDDVVAAAPLQPLPWQGSPPDVAVNLHGKGPQSHLVLRALRPRTLVAFAQPDLGHDGPPFAPPAGGTEHEVTRWNRMLDTATDGRSACTVQDLRLPVPTGPSPRPGAVVVHPGAAAPSRRWPAGRFAAVAARLRASGHEVVVTGSADEAGLTAAVVEAARLPATSDLGGRLGLDALHALVAEAALVVVGDTGVGHLATASGAPSVHLFGPEPPAAWGPAVDLDRHRVLWHEDAGRTPATSGERAPVDPRLARVSVEDVLSVGAQLLQAPVSREA